MSDPGTALRVVPLVAVLGFLGFGVGWRSWWHWRRYGTSGIVLLRAASPWQRIRNALVVPFVAFILVEAVTMLWAPAKLSALGVMAIPSALRWLGAALAFGAIALMVVAQVQLGASWRIGIDDGARPGLVTDGMYRFSRNPIYAWWLLWMIGFILLVPTWASLALVAAWSVAIRGAVRDEEAYLLRSYGDAYVAYARRVGRFVPLMGRWHTA